MSDIVERLNEIKAEASMAITSLCMERCCFSDCDCDNRAAINEATIGEAAANIIALQGEVERLRAALKLARAELSQDGGA